MRNEKDIRRQFQRLEVMIMKGQEARATRDRMLRELYCDGAKPAELARLTGLTRQRVFQIVAI